MLDDPEQLEEQIEVILKLSSDRALVEYVALQGMLTPDIIEQDTVDVPGK